MRLPWSASSDRRRRACRSVGVIRNLNTNPLRTSILHLNRNPASHSNMSLQSAHDVALLISSPNSASERRITPSWSIANLKTRLEPVTGIPASCQTLSLRIGSQQPIPIQAADEETTQLSSFPLQPYAEIYVSATSNSFLLPLLPLVLLLVVPRCPKRDPCPIQGPESTILLVFCQLHLLLHDAFSPWVDLLPGRADLRIHPPLRISHIPANVIARTAMVHVPGRSNLPKTMRKTTPFRLDAGCFFRGPITPEFHIISCLLSSGPVVPLGRSWTQQLETWFAPKLRTAETWISALGSVRSMGCFESWICLVPGGNH